jgi:hypothetical protein
LQREAFMRTILSRRDARSASRLGCGVRNDWNVNHFPSSCRSMAALVTPAYVKRTFALRIFSGPANVNSQSRSAYPLLGLQTEGPDATCAWPS